jgi:23S rRNA (uracil1939-C5)-methyltransferase
MAIPLCPYYGKCGGCNWQHIEYTVQLEMKRSALAHALHSDDVEAHSANEYHYRNRMDLLFSKDGLGFRKHGKWSEILDIERCEIATKRLNDLIKELRVHFKGVDAFDMKKQTGTFRYAVIRAPNHDSSISFVLNKNSMKIAEAIEKIKQFADKTTANNVIITYVPADIDASVSEDYFVVKGSDMITETLLDNKFKYSVQGFFQNNTAVAEKMHEYCHSLLKKYSMKDSKLKEGQLIDLYAGVGTFGINNAEFFKRVTIIESVKPCIDAANKNIEENKIANAKAFLLEAKQINRVDFIEPLFVITDPPRSGMDTKVIEYLKRMKPKVIIYISCNVLQLKKDLNKFKEYQLKSAALFDMFPQTVHSEAVVELVRT